MPTTQRRIADVCHEWDYANRRCEESVPVFQVEEASPPAYFFVSKLAVDADGDPRAYHPTDTRPPHNDSGAYDWLDNISVSDLHGIQGQDALGPAPGFYVSATSLADPAVKDEKDAARWVPASSVPYIVLPNGFPGADGATSMGRGDCALVVDLNTGRAAAAIFADVGRAVGEASLRLALDLGLNPFHPKYPPKVTGFDGKRFLYLVFPGVTVPPPWNPVEIAQRTDAVFTLWGGMARLGELFPVLLTPKTVVPVAVATAVGANNLLPPAHDPPPPVEVPPPRALRIGMEGTDVMRWQVFLIGQGFDPGVADGVFGSRTLAATKAFQVRNKAEPDGVFGLQSVLKATAKRFPLLEEPAEDQSGSNWPPRPSFPPLAGADQRQAIFGAYRYVSAPEPDNAEAIRILGTWEDDNVVRVEVPQLRGIKGAPDSGKVRFHRLVADQLQALFAAWETAGLLGRMLTWDGSFVPRFIRGSRTVLSNHAFGSAFDVNYEWNQLGHIPALVDRKGCARELVSLAHEHGFYWGGHFKNRLDGMHFEIAVIK